MHHQRDKKEAKVFITEASNTLSISKQLADSFFFASVSDKSSQHVYKTNVATENREVFVFNLSQNNKPLA